MKRSLRELEPRLRDDRSTHHAMPLIAGGFDATGRAAVEIRNPADLRDVVGSVVEADAADVAAAVGQARSAGRDWSALPAGKRADCLERVADEIEAQRDSLMLLAVREAGKTAGNAAGEVREAVDFCRYYAAQARRELGTATARGPFACIAPWNFPLAIFVGQISAALAAGNPVLAKPAEQTPLLAAAAVRLFHRAGVPPAALQLLPGTGETVGAALVGDPRIAGVLFTGSTTVAQQINRVLARAQRRPGADCRNRWAERDDRRQLGAAGTGRRRCAGLRVRQRRTTVLGAAHPLRAGRHRRAGADRCCAARCGSCASAIRGSWKPTSAR